MISSLNWNPMFKPDCWGCQVSRRLAEFSGALEGAASDLILYMLERGATFTYRHTTILRKCHVCTVYLNRQLTD
jgi:hypothetical protein